jgi:cation transport ATPase
MNKNNHRALQAVRTAVMVFAVTLAFVIAGFAAPTTVGQLINPHSNEGSKGMTAVFGVFLLILLVLLVSLPISIAGLVREPASRSKASFSLVVIGTIIAMFLGFTAVATLVHEKL